MAARDDERGLISRSTVGALVEVTRELAMTTDLTAILALICRGIVEVAEFESAAINLVTDDGDLQVVAVAGPPEVGEALMGTTGSRDAWDRELAATEPHHALLLSRGVDHDGVTNTWVSDDTAWFEGAKDDPSAWRPEYSLYVPMQDPAGELLGVVSFDLPRSRLLPDEVQSATVEMLVRQAEHAIVGAHLLARSELNERVYRLAFDTAPTLTAIAEPGGRLVEVNRAFADAFGPVVDAAAFDRAVTVLDDAPGLEESLAATFTGAAPTATFVAVVERSAGPRWFHVTVRGIAHASSVPSRAVCSLVDISLERREQMRHQHDAEHDPLTGLLNRRGARAAMDAVVARVDLPLVVVLAADLDGFKAANDRFGHLVGDEVLVETAARLRRVVPEGSALVRLGGDEFLVLTRCADRDAAGRLAEQVVTAMRTAFDVGQAATGLSVSVGVAATPVSSAVDVAALVDEADRALYEAKSAGRGRWAVAPESPLPQPLA